MSKYYYKVSLYVYDKPCQEYGEFTFSYKVTIFAELIQVGSMTTKGWLVSVRKATSFEEHAHLSPPSIVEEVFRVDSELLSSALAEVIKFLIEELPYDAMVPENHKCVEFKIVPEKLT